ncbi:MAG: hypothetical protein K2O10_04670, partial [Muribaculaceae bacterium]|nr:hypothetical protein [Muribaculaceae bacterium]
MIYVVIALVALALGAVAGWLWGRNALAPEVARLAERQQAAGEQLERERAAFQSQIDQERHASQERLSQLRADHEQQRAEADRRWHERFETLKAELGKMQADALALKQASLAEQNTRQLGDLLAPVKEQ